jgi:hypothetical protein
MLIKSTATFLSLYPSIHPSMATFMHVFAFTIDLLGPAANKLTTTTAKKKTSYLHLAHYISEQFSR